MKNLGLFKNKLKKPYQNCYKYQFFKNNIKYYIY